MTSATDNRTTELASRREATALLEEFLCGYQNILLSRGIDASEAVCKQNELIDEYGERIEQAIAATLGSEREKALEELVRDMWREMLTCPDYATSPCMTNSICERVRNLGIEVNR